jgi:hypothetical protein
VEQRGAPDRRRRPTSWPSRYWLVGRRRGGRRAGEQQDVYVDRYGPWEWAAIAVLIGLSLADLLMTLDLLRHGGSEANPLMQWALDQGVPVFVGLKLGLTLLGALVLLVRVRFRGIRTALAVLLVLYVALIGYHLALRDDLRVGRDGAVRQAAPP